MRAQTKNLAPPHSVEAERALLGAMLISNEIYHQVSGYLLPDHFYDQKHKKTFEVFASMISAGKYVDHITTKEALADLGDLDAYFRVLVSESATTVNGAAYGQRVYDLAMRRKLLAIGEQLARSAVEDYLDVTPQQMIDATETKLLDLTGFDYQRHLLDNRLGEWNVGEIKMPSPRQWLLGTVFARGFVSSLLSEGAGGKTATRYAQYLARATGRNLTGEHVFQRCRVLIISLEDNTEELQRRLLAAMMHYGIDKSEVDGWLWAVAPGKSAGKIMATDEKGHARIGELTAKIAGVVEHRRIDLVGLDPFVKSHSVEENQNSAVDDVMQVLADLCATHNIAIDVPHHVSKGGSDPGNSNRGRGASAMRDAARLVYTLTKMNPDEAKAFGVSEDDRKYLIRVDNAKVNIAPPAAKAQWFKLIGVELGNGNELYPAGDTVQTVIQWTPPGLFTDLSVEVINRILDKIDAGLPDGERYSDAAKATTRAAWKVVVEMAPGKKEGPAKRVITEWLKTGLLKSLPYDSPERREKVNGLFVDNSKRPGSSVPD